MGGIGLPELTLLLFFVIVPILWVIFLIDILKNEFTGQNKLIWLIIVFFIPVVGLFLYYFIGKSQKITNI